MASGHRQAKHLRRFIVVMLALHPERVNMAQAQHFASSSQQRAQRYPVLGDGQSAKLAWAVQDLHPLGAVGQASAATAEKGRAVLQASAQVLAQLLTEACELPPM